MNWVGSDLIGHCLTNEIIDGSLPYLQALWLVQIGHMINQKSTMNHLFFQFFEWILIIFVWPSVLTLKWCWSVTKLTLIWKQRLTPTIWLKKVVWIQQNSEDLNRFMQSWNFVIGKNFYLFHFSLQSTKYGVFVTTYLNS